MAQITNPRVKGRTSAKPTTTIEKTVPTLNITKPGLGDHLCAVLFGPPKTGKTVASVSGKGKKLLILTEPDGDLPLVGRDDVDVVRPADGKELYEIVEALHRGAVESYDRVVLDSVTFAFELLGRKAVAKAVADNVDIRKPYGQVGAALTQIIHDIVALPVDKVFITQLRSEYIDDDDPDEAGPEEGKYPFTLAVTPMVYKILAPAASVLGRTSKRMFISATGNKTVQYFVSFEDYGKSPAGSRIPIDPVVENLNMDLLIDQLKGK